MNKISKFVVVVLAGVFMLTTSVFAKPAENNNQTSGTGNIDTNIEMLDNQIENAIRKIENNKKEISDTQTQISNLQKDISGTENDIKLREDIFKKRARVAYISGVDNYLDVLLNSKDIQDFLWRVEAVRKIIEFDNNVIGQLNTKKEKLLVTQKQLKDKNNNLLALKSDNENKLAKLKTDKENQKKLLAQTSQRSYALASVSGSKNNLSRGSLHITSTSNNDVIGYASNFLGTPYVWGGSSPSGFDCSGFTQYVYGHFGVGLGRTTYDQINDGTAVSKDQLQPGDLVFFGSSSNPHHVGIYIGNGAYIHAPRTGDVIKVSSVDRNDFVTGRRVK